VASINNIVIDQGTSFTLSVTLTNDDGTPKNLTTYAVNSQLRKSYYTNTFTAFTTSKVNLKAGRYVYDIEIEDPSETVRVIEGIVTVTPEVTR
jgi:hypothetical protein